MKAKSKRFNREIDLVDWLNKQPLTRNDILNITYTSEAWNSWVVIYIEEDTKNKL